MIRRFEVDHGIRLPADYRAFLLMAGDGGAGPYNGLLPLHESNAWLVDRPHYLARPSPLRPGMPNDRKFKHNKICSPEDFFQGTLPIVSLGCTGLANLVISGVYRGQIVYIDLDRGFSPYFVHHSDFLSWYERWLDELLWGYDDEWFGFGLPGREQDLVLVLRQAGKPDLRGEALATLKRMAALQPETLQLLPALLSAETAQVRANACELLGKHGVAAACAGITARIEDGNPAVRKAALDALTKLPDSDWENAARRLLGDVDEPVAFRALCLLMKTCRLRRADVEPLFQSSKAGVRRSGLWAAGTLEGVPIEVPDRLLRDPDSLVRIEAYRRWRPTHPGRVAVLCDLLRLETNLDAISVLISLVESTGDRAAVPSLIEMTGHADAFVRLDAAMALGELGDRRAIPALMELLSDNSKPRRPGNPGERPRSSPHTVSQIARTALERLQE